MNEIIRRSSVDPEFRKLCLVNARKAIAQVSDLPVPDGFRARFIESEGYNMTIVLPEPALPESELSEADLAQVAGGTGGDPMQPRIEWDPNADAGQAAWLAWLERGK
ncbi:MAG: hypothetical protein FJW20_05620 [Acidimicrobiia bacterium]|nr:hypothetical protein [Acidimicrobiia bacterium]